MTNFSVSIDVECDMPDWKPKPIPTLENIKAIPKLHELFERKLHTKIQINNRNLRELIDKFSGMTILRSCDLMTIAYEKQLFVKYDFHEELLDALLWGLKLRGCSVSEQEIDEIIKIEINKSA